MTAAPCTALGIDVGGTKTSIGAVSFPGGQVVIHETIPTKPQRGSEVVLEEIAGHAEALTAESAKNGHSISAVCVAICELVDQTGEIRSDNCIAWKAGGVKSRLGRIGPVTVEADVRAAARAEALFGAGRPFRLFLY